MFCGPRANCALALFGCDSFNRLRGFIRGCLVTQSARTVHRPPPAFGFAAALPRERKELQINRISHRIAVGFAGEPQYL